MDDRWENTTFNDVAVDSEGNVIVAGSIDDPAGEYGGLLFVRKYDPCGFTLWTSTFDPRPGGLPRGAYDADIANQALETGGGGYGADARGVTTDLAGNIYVTGGWAEPSEPLRIPGDGGARGTIPHSFTRMLDPDGREVWTMSEPSRSGEDIAADEGGNVYVVGSRWCMGDCPSTSPLPWMVKYRTVAGVPIPEIVWEKDDRSGDFPLAPTPSSWGRFWGIALGVDHLYVTGNRYPAFLGSAIWVRKYGIGGDLDRSFGEEGEILRGGGVVLGGLDMPPVPPGWDEGRGIAIDPEGDILVSGFMSFPSGIYCTAWVGGECRFEESSTDAWVNRFDSGGVELWDPPLIIDSGGDESALDVVPVSSGGGYMLIQRSSIPVMDEFGFRWLGVRDYDIVRFARNGEVIWEQSVEADDLVPGLGFSWSDNRGGGMAVDRADNAFVTGNFTSSSAFGSRRGFTFLKKLPADGFCPAEP